MKREVHPITRARMSYVRQGVLFTEEHRQRISKSMIGLTRSIETRKRMSKPKSLETRMKMSKAKQGSNHPMFGIKGLGHNTYGKTWKWYYNYKPIRRIQFYPSKISI